MNAKRKNQLDTRAGILKAMAHPTRLLVLEELADGERCVCDLQTLIGSDMSTVSKHLSVLKTAGLIEPRRAGMNVFYTLMTPCLLQFFSCIEAALAGLPICACAAEGAAE
ncbi:MAG: winged helix-turn-helix transcriptional regulator [Phycisphaerales bacterium]|jgi:DNA-binding transcriptional ArsR family regulator|nr:winged helix-turn-helix transcriptional regulator [Phycisphaerales bacterium]MBT7171125.1 winged helix-turn-helix transcriptional regulator [Phycisphaerales bacterium]